MALGKNCSTSKARPLGLRTSKADALDEILNFGNCTRTLRRKRVVVSNYMELSSSSSSSSSSSPLGSPLKTPSKKRIGARLNSERESSSPFKTPSKKRFGARLNLERSSLEALPEDILVRILYCVDHDDLKQLFHVSKIVRKATLIAKQCHFAFSTPSSKTASIRPFSNLEDDKQFDIETPDAPKRRGSYYRPRISREKLTDISVALFHSPEEEEDCQSNSGLFMKTEI